MAIYYYANKQSAPISLLAAFLMSEAAVTMLAIIFQVRKYFTKEMAKDNIFMLGINALIRCVHVN